MRFFILSLLAMLLTACTPSSLVVTPDFATLTPQAIPTAGETSPAPDDGTSTPIPTDTPEPVVETDAEGEYFRGFFDMCMHDYGNVTYCLKLTKSARAAGWYMQPSVGWVWPFEVSY